MIWLLIFGMLMFAGAIVSFRQRKRILDTPTALATSAAIGRAELYGVARGEPPEVSPITGKACAYWEAELWEYRKGRKTQWIMAARETANADHIWLEDKSGRIPIFLYGVQWALEGEDEFSRKNPLPGTAHAFLERYGFSWDPARIKVKERRIEEGGAIYVLGTLSESHDVAHALSDSSAISRLARGMLQMSDRAQRAASRQPVQKTDNLVQPSGSIGIPESAAAAPAIGRVGLSRAMLDPVNVLQGRLQPNDVVVWCALDGLLIGNCDQSKVAQGLLRTTFFCLLGGVVMFVLAIVL